MEKIKNLNEAIAQEKDTREMWIGRFEKEQRKQQDTQNELTNLKGAMQDMTLRIKQKEMEIESVCKSRDLHKSNCEKLQS